MNLILTLYMSTMSWCLAVRSTCLMTDGEYQLATCDLPIYTALGYVPILEMYVKFPPLRCYMPGLSRQKGLDYLEVYTLTMQFQVLTITSSLCLPPSPSLPPSPLFLPPSPSLPQMWDSRWVEQLKYEAS